MITILIAPDKFKGTLSAPEAADIISHGLASLKARIVTIPMADGGEGTSETLSRLLGMTPRRIAARNSIMEPIDGGAGYYFNPSTRTAAIDSSAVLGLGLLRENAPSPMTRSSYPLGEAMLSIIRNDNPSLLYIGVGGTSTVDGGAGFLQALGYKFFNGDSELSHPLTADMLASITRISPPSAILLPRIIALSDVNAPLVAPEGYPSSLTFAPQKGATKAEISSLSESLTRMSSLLPSTASSCDGAGGGIGYALALIGAESTSGASFLIDLADIPSLRPDIIITGEGSLDSQTSMGKAVSAFADYGIRNHTPVLAVGGRVLPDFKLQGITATFSTQLYPPHNCLNYHTASMRLKAAAHDIALWIGHHFNLLAKNY